MISLVIIALATFVGFVISRWMVRSLETSMQGVKALSSGDLSQQFVAKRTDEFGQLDHSLNELVLQFKSTLGNALDAVASLNEMAFNLTESNKNLGNSSLRVEENVTQIHEVISIQDELLSHTVQSTTQLAQLLNIISNKA